MSNHYASRQAALLAALSKYANGTLHAESEPAGMHLVALLGGKQRDKTTDTAVADAASAAGIPVQALSTYFAGPADLSGLVLGYAGFTEDEIDAATKVLCASIKHRS